MLIVRIVNGPSTALFVDKYAHLRVIAVTADPMPERGKGASASTRPSPSETAPKGPLMRWPVPNSA